MENDNIDIFNSAEFLFAKPYSQNYYVYTIDDLDELSIIDKDSLKSLLVKLKCYDFIKTEYLLSRNLPLFFDIKNKKLHEFELNFIEKQNISKIIKEELKIKEKETSTYDFIFGKDSTFYKQNIYDKELKLWQL